MRRPARTRCRYRRRRRRRRVVVLVVLCTHPQPPLRFACTSPPPPAPLSPPAGMSSSFHFSSRRRRRRRSRSRPLAAAFTAVDPAPSRHPLRTLFVFSLVSARSPYRDVNHDCPVSGTRCVTCNIQMTPIQFLLSGSLIFHSHPVIRFLLTQYRKGRVVD